MFIAAGLGRVDVVGHVVEVGADKDQADNSGAIALLLTAAQKGLRDIVRHLVKVGTQKFWGISVACCSRRRQSGHGSVVEGGTARIAPHSGG